LPSDDDDDVGHLTIDRAVCIPDAPVLAAVSRDCIGADDPVNSTELF
jgi:hypothetical protein